MALDDFFRDSPSFVNPEYVTPAQRAQQRAYSEMLMKRSAEKVNRPTGAIANMIDALTGRLEMNRAGNLEQQALGSQNKNITDYASALMQGGGQQASLGTAPTDRMSVGSIAQPMGNVGDAILPPATAPNNAQRAEVQSSPKVWGDKEAEAAGLYPPTQVASFGPAGGSAPSGGAQAQPPVLPTGAAPAANQRVAQAFDPKLIGRMSTNQMATPEQRALVEGLMQRKLGEDVYGNPTETSVMGGVKALPVGQGVTPGFRSPTSIAPTGISGVSVNPAPQAGGAGPSGLQVGGAGGLKGAMDTMNTLGTNAARSGAINEFQKQDLQSANDAPTIKRVAGIMLNDLQTHGDKMTFGPTAEWTNNVKKIAANYAPGLMKDQLEAIASADSFDKMSAQLTSLLAKGGGTDAQLFNNMRSVPGSHNSKEGAEALLQMTMQVADQQQALARATSGVTDPQSYQAAKEKFYRENPIINPITKQPIVQDLQGQKQIMSPPTGYKVLKVY